MEHEESFLDLWKQLGAAYGPEVWGGLLAIVVTFIIELILSSKGIIFAGQEKKLEKAKKAGHVIQAKKINSYYEERSYGTKVTERWYHNRFEYEINGQIRNKVLITKGTEASETIYLYYVSNPDKVFSEYDLKRSPFTFLIYIIPILVGYAVAKALGFQG